jgi:hypothetical protein
MSEEKSEKKSVFSKIFHFIVKDTGFDPNLDK